MVHAKNAKAKVLDAPKPMIFLAQCWIDVVVCVAATLPIKTSSLRRDDLVFCALASKTLSAFIICCLPVCNLALAQQGRGEVRPRRVFFLMIRRPPRSTPATKTTPAPQ